MEYLNKIVGYAKDLREMIPKNLTSSIITPKMANPSPAIPLNLDDGFGIEEWLFFGVAIALFVAIIMMKYDGYRLFQMASKEMRKELARDLRELLEEKFDEEFFEQFAHRISQHSISQSTQVEPSELILDTSNQSVEEPFTTPPVTPKTPGRSRIPLPSYTTPKRRSNSSPNKKSDRGDHGTTWNASSLNKRN